MIVVMDRACLPDEVAHVTAVLTAAGIEPTRTLYGGRIYLITAEIAPPGLVARIRLLPGVETISEPTGSLRLTSRTFCAKGTVVDVSGVPVGGEAFVVAAGPCAVESQRQLVDTAHVVALTGGVILRGGLYKPRTSPYTFQGLGRQGLELLAEQRAETGLPVVTEVLDMAHLDAVLEVADMIQIGSRNAQNFTLLREVGWAGRPVLLKRGMASTIEEWLLAAEYVLANGNSQVVLCERGIRSFEPATRFTLDLSAIPVVKQLSHLPIIVDPSHAAGRRDLVVPLALAAAAVGADGLLVDVHTDAATARCDGRQALNAEDFSTLIARLDRLLASIGRPLASSPPSSRIRVLAGDPA
jgi:3-deoxy-7-phosphoheptulonate synthase